MITNATISELNLALENVNKKYANNIIFNRYPDKVGNRNSFTLRVTDSSAPGHRLGYRVNKNGKRRRLSSACWHVHGDFFDALFEIRKDIYIFSRNSKITIDEGNWKDVNVGSPVFPIQFSELCECN